MLETIKAAAAWLSVNVDPAVPRALFVVAVLLAVLVLRKAFPRVWESFAGVVPVDVIDPAPVLLVLSKAWQAIPGAVIGAGTLALSSGGDVRAAVKGAVLGALAALAHEVMKAVPWIPYRGEVGKTKLPALPLLYLLGVAAFCVAQPGLSGCSTGPVAPGQPRADSAVSLLGVAHASTCLGLPEMQCRYADTYVPRCAAVAIVRAEQTMLATAAHCVPEGMTSAIDQRFYAPSGWGHGHARLVDRDDAADLALFAPTDPDLLTALQLGPTPLIGATVSSYSPVYRTSQSGRVSAWLGEDWIETTQSVVAGWSGSPVLDDHGDLVGLIAQCPYSLKGQALPCTPGRTVVALLR